MDDRASFARRGVARLLIGPLAALCLAVPALAGPGQEPQEKNEAEKAEAKAEAKAEKAEAKTEAEAAE